MKYAIYKIDTGQIDRIATCDDPELQLQEGEAYIEGEANDINYYVKDGEFVYRGPPPSVWSVWNGTAWIDPRTEQQIYDDASNDVRSQRDKLLSETDWTDTASAPVRLGQVVYDNWQLYRQQLRDVPSQPGFPFNVVWPVKPY
jgi:hypothetical protein